MFPSGLVIFIFICITIIIMALGFVLPKVIGTVTEIILIIIALSHLFMTFQFPAAMMIMSICAMFYGSFGMLLNEGKRKKRESLKQKIINNNYEEIYHARNKKRILVDLLLTLLVSSGAIVFLVFAPEMYAMLKLFILFGLISVISELIVRIGNYASTTLYILPEQEQLIIISFFESRQLPLQDLKDVKKESEPDLLRLHPLFTFLSENTDYTNSFQAVLRLSFPGENIYITPTNIQKWQSLFGEYILEEKSGQVTEVLPIWHPKNIKRFFWKGYFAVTVKGVSAYTGLLFLLIWLEVSPYVMIGFILFWWLFNLYISDRVLIASTDGVELTGGEIYNKATELFKQAEIPQLKVYLIDSPIHNGLATGMNIGRGTIMLTTATTELSMGAIEAILAHETIHVKKRDVLIHQVARMVFFGVIASLAYIFIDQITLLAENLLIFIPLFYVLMMLFPMYLSFVSQWLEVRADYLGAKLLDQGRVQMAEGLTELGIAGDKAMDKTFEYSIEEIKPMKKTSSLERDNWFFRVLEFQFQLHPPLYFRINILHGGFTWRQTLQSWMVARVRECIPFI